METVRAVLHTLYHTTINNIFVSVRSSDPSVESLEKQERSGKPQKHPTGLECRDSDCRVLRGTPAVSPFEKLKQIVDESIDRWRNNCQLFDNYKLSVKQKCCVLCLELSVVMIYCSFIRGVRFDVPFFQCY